MSYDGDSFGLYTGWFYCRGGRSSHEFKRHRGWCGTTQFYDRDGACIFDFISQSEPLLTAAILYAHADFAAFLQFVKAGLYVLLRQSRLIKRGDSFQINLNSELARMLTTGYFKGEPCMADIGIDLENGVLVPPVIRRVNLPLHGLRDVFSGSKKAFEPFEDIYPINREEAISFVCDYIQACVNGPVVLPSKTGHLI